MKKNIEKRALTCIYAIFVVSLQRNWIRMGYMSMYRAMSKAMQPTLQKSSGTAKMQLYLAINGQQSGPFTKTEAEQLVKRGTLTAETLVWEAGMVNWAPAATLPHVNKLLLLHAPKRKAKVESQKSKVASPEPKAEHPLRQDLISAMSNLGMKGPEMNKAIDRLLDEQPQIDISEAIKKLLVK